MNEDLKMKELEFLRSNVFEHGLNIVEFGLDVFLDRFLVFRYVEAYIKSN